MDAFLDTNASAPKTSVVIPVFNTKDYLPACLDSILAQTQKEFEVILVDDGSTDGSLEIEQAYASRDPRIRVITQPNLRQGAARNRGLEAARGECVYFMDSDDVIVPEHFETCYRACKDNELDFVVFETVGFVDDPAVERPELFGEICDRRGKISEEVMDGSAFWTEYFPKGLMPFICWLEYFDRSFLLENELQFVEGIYFEDNDWIVRVFMAAKRVKFMPLRLRRYRSRPGSNVHAGFTPVLADSCFDVHAILCELARAHRDPAHLEMIQSVSYVKDHRFRQFAQLEPSEYLSELSSCFARFVLEECARDDLPETVRSMHFASIVSLAEGVLDWPHPPVVFTRELAKALLNFKTIDAGSPMRIGIYGTGKACQGLLKVFDAGASTCFFLETDAAPNQRFRGKRVTSIKDAQRLNLNAIIISSAKYAEEMKTNIAQYLGSDMPVYVAPRRIYVLADPQIANIFEHPRLHKAQTLARRAAWKLRGRLGREMRRLRQWQPRTAR